jgi:hypothetical protein
MPLSEYICRGPDGMPRVILGLPELTHLCKITNRIGLKLNGNVDNCVLMSATLNEILTLLGIPSEFMRVRAAVYKREDRRMIVIGGDGQGERRPAAGKDKWWAIS